ncbi:MAG TPA: MarR family transcriptional regulator [Propionicimonas sp.]|nr:MarR family transcriptional regulator [Propionicimonas sp.]HQA78472.1 MarR family transcriptional regulator [Propionicimonas sp.]HQD97758.1 MarR family transcriptional regulator [Propionicimonas sp.]
MDSLVALAADLRIACQRVSRRVRFESSTEIAPHLVSAMANLRHGPLTPGELAEVERISAPSMTRTVNCLVDKGLVAREDHPSDGRCKVLTLTASGHDLLDRVAQARNDWMVHQLEGLTDAERQLLREATDLLTQVVSK